MTMHQMLALHARLVLLLAQAWQMRHELDDIEDLFEQFEILYPAHFFERCRSLLDDWIFFCTDLVCTIHGAIVQFARHLD